MPKQTMIIQGVECFNEYLLPQEKGELENTGKGGRGSQGRMGRAGWVSVYICVGGKKEREHCGQKDMYAGLNEDGRTGCS